MTDVERRLSAALDQVAATTVAPDGWAEVAGSPAGRRAAPGRRSPIRWAAVAAGFAVVIAVIGLVPALLPLGEADRFFSDAGPPILRTTSPPLVIERDGELPRLVLSLAGARVVSAERFSLVPSDGPPSPNPAFHEFYAAGPDRFTPPLLHIATWTDVTGASRPAGSQEVEVRGGTAYLTEVGSTLAVEWRDGDTGYVRVESFGLGVDELLALVETLEPRASGWDAVGLPPGVEPVYEGEHPLDDPGNLFAFHVIRYEVAGGSVVIRLGLVDPRLDAGAPDLPSLTGDAAFGEAEVRGRPARLVRKGPASFEVFWAEPPAIVGAMEINVPESQLAEVFEALEEVDEGQWRQVVASVEGS